MRFTYLLVSTLFCISACAPPAPSTSESSPDPYAKTTVSIEGNKFLINGNLTYGGKTWEGNSIEGLLFNARLVQGVFDDLNPETRSLFVYPDTQEWDPERNTDEFIAAMPDWYAHGLLAFTLNLQGGSPTGYGNKEWYNSTFDEQGNPRSAYLGRLEKILDAADSLGMVVILGYFYFGQDQYVESEAGIIHAVDTMTQWILERGYRNVLVEINNECDVRAYDHEILTPSRVHELIQRVKDKTHEGRRLLVGTSFKGRAIPTHNVVEVSDFILIHGNGVSDPPYITQMVDSTKALPSYTGQPIVFNEDDHYDYDSEDYNLKRAIESYASWGYFDFRRKDESDIQIGFQSVPVDWRINSPRKIAFFEKIKEITQP